MTLTVEQLARMQCEVQRGATWQQRTAQVPDTAEARELWDRIPLRSPSMSLPGTHTLDVLSDG